MNEGRGLVKRWKPREEGEGENSFSSLKEVRGLKDDKIGKKEKKFLSSSGIRRGGRKNAIVRLWNILGGGGEGKERPCAGGGKERGI